MTSPSGESNEVFPWSCDTYWLYVQPKLTQSRSNDGRFKHEIFCQLGIRDRLSPGLCNKGWSVHCNGWWYSVCCVAPPPRHNVFVTLLDELISWKLSHLPGGLSPGAAYWSRSCIGIHTICTSPIWSHQNLTFVSGPSGVMELFWSVHSVARGASQ